MNQGWGPPSQGYGPPPMHHGYGPMGPQMPPPPQPESGWGVLKVVLIVFALMTVCGMGGCLVCVGLGSYNVNKAEQAPPVKSGSTGEKRS